MLYLPKIYVTLTLINMPFNKETAAEAGRKSRKGAHQKTKEWKELGEHITGMHSARFNSILLKADDATFAELYLKVLGYFQPKKLYNIHEESGPKVIEINNLSNKFKLGEDLKVEENE